MKKAIGQTVRDIKRGVNKKVLKVPSIEQKVLDATSNEPWGPHGSNLADIAQASRNYHEFQMIMATLWKRINDTGKNWRHVYKALTVLEYLVANGSERIIDEIREHAYQISTLSDFQYIDSTGRDQGSNVRKKSQSLVALVNDKERIQEVRQKAATNKDKFRNRPGGYDDNRYEGRYGSREEERNGYGREREWGDDKYGRYGDSYARNGDRYGEEYRGRSRSVDGDNYASRSRSSDGDGERSYEDDGQYSRDSNAKADDQSQDGSVVGGRPDRRFSEQNLEAPPSYEDAVGEGRSPVHSERDGETAATSIPPSSSPPISTSHQENTAVSGGSPDPAAAPPPQPPPAATRSPPAATSGKENDGFDEFDPRGSFPGAEMDLLGSLSDSFYSNSMALVPSEPDSFTNSDHGQSQTFGATSSDTQPFEDPFGDGPFRAIPSTDGFSSQPQSTSGEPPQPVGPTSGEPHQPFGPTSGEPTQPFGPTSGEPPQPFGPTSGEPPKPFGPTSGEPPQPVSHTFDHNTDILADLLPPSGPSPTSFQGQPDPLSTQTGYTSQPSHGFTTHQTQPVFPSSFPGQLSHNGQSLPQQHGFAPQNMPFGGFSSQMGSVPHQGFLGSNGQSAQPSNFYGGFEPQGSSAPVPPQYNTSNFYQQPQVQPTITASSGALAIVPQQPANDKFETKSTVWADTLNRGLVNLNISGPKTNPLSNIGIDFEAMNRKDKRMEKPSPNPVTSNVTMGKAMGSGSGIGRAGAGALRAPPGPMMPGASAAPGFGVGYGALNHHPMGLNNMGMGQGFQMQPPPAGFPPGPPMAGNYNPMMGQGGGYGQQPPYGGGYR